jgi:simple sugar transport system ATP-binding protein
MMGRGQGATEPPPRLEAVGISKHFSRVTALDNVSLSIEPGAFHVLLGENGAGKSTLVKCIMGYCQSDAGDIMVDGEKRRIASPRNAHDLGIGMVYQHFTLVPNMSVEENLLLSRSHLPGVVRWGLERANMEAFLARMPFTVDLSAPVATLSAGEKQKLEILKQLYLDYRILILDEPTSVLTPGEADEILDLLKHMTQAGELSVLMITHKLREVRAYAEDVTVLRQGRVSGKGHARDLSPVNLTQMMVGKMSIPTPAERVLHVDQPIRLRLSEVSADDDRGHRALSGISLEVRGSEIVGIAGVSGNGQKEMAEVLAGQRELAGGRTFVHGKPYRATRSEMRRHKVFCLPEEPLRNACVASMLISENLAFRRFDVAPFAQGGVLINRAAMRSAAYGMIDQFRIKASSPDARVDTLSGGNVQRMVLARELSHDVEVLVVANPCFGLDVAAIGEIRSRIMQARNKGAAVLLVSEDLDELFELSDRIMVMFEGTINYMTDIADADRATIGRYMAGGGDRPPLTDPP